MGSGIVVAEAAEVALEEMEETARAMAAEAEADFSQMAETQKRWNQAVILLTLGKPLAEAAEEHPRQIMPETAAQAETGPATSFIRK